MSEHLPEDSDSLSIEYQHVKQPTWSRAEILGRVAELRAIGVHKEANILFLQYCHKDITDPTVEPYKSIFA